MNRGHNETEVRMLIKGEKNEIFVKQQRNDSFKAVFPFCRSIKQKNYFTFFGCRHFCLG